MAATCIPSAIEPRSVGERTTWEQLRDNCPTNWLIFSNCYVRKDPKVASLYREADIIVIANKRIFVIEIKDGKHFESSKGEWYREGNLIRNPITQVNSLKGMLLVY